MGGADGAAQRNRVELMGEGGEPYVPTPTETPNKSRTESRTEGRLDTHTDSLANIKLLENE